ncbi:hypothetical protein [Microbacterium sp.]|uniref:FMN-binding protein n=1 Tax=Microbacterium sp. TaxID=51671 RepID=UPI002612E4F0|nr:hypothetical protein [Microbacterium sp.]
MISSATASSPVRKGAALAGLAGALVLAGCSGAADAEGDTAAVDGYNDGTYTADGSYQTPETVEQISVTVTLEAGVVSEVTVEGDPQAPETEQYQGAFISGIAEEVVGVAIDDLDVSRVAGSSLTSGGFNAAVEDIKSQAAK